MGNVKKLLRITLNVNNAIETETLISLAASANMRYLIDCVEFLGNAQCSYLHRMTLGCRETVLNICLASCYDIGYGWSSKARS